MEQVSQTNTPEGLKTEVAHLLEDNGEFLYLNESIWQAAADGVLPLEDMLLALPMSQWRVMVMVLEAGENLSNWDVIQSHLSLIRTRDDIRYDYLDMHEANLLVSGKVQLDSLEAVEKLLTFYADSNMRYARKVYTEHTLAEAREVMPQSIRGAYWMELALACGEEQHEQRMNYLKKAAGEWPQLGTIAKSYVSLLGEPQEKQAHIVLSIALLVSNRKDTIRQCLDSLTPIREAIPSQLILVDTGCDADLRALLEEYGDVVADFTWCNDFSKARNETLKYATGEWYLYLDDDEWFVDSQELIDFFVSGEYKNYGRASYIQRNFLDMEATQYTDSWVSRMTKLHPDTHFESKIHEYMEPAVGDCKGIRAIVHHFGYVYETEEALQKHYERNRVLLEEMIEEEPDNLRWRIQLAQEYRSVREYEKLYALGEECLALTAERDERYDNIAIGGFYGAKVIADRERERYKECLKTCLEAEKDKRNTELCQAFLVLNMARAYFFLGNYRMAEQKAGEYLRWKDFFAENEPILYLQKPVPFVGECLDLVYIKEGYSLLICSGLRQGNTQYLERYLDELHWDEQHVYVFEGMADTLITAMNTLPSCPAFERTLRLMYGQSALWDYMREQICEYEQSGHQVAQLMDLIRRVIPEAVATQEEPVQEQSVGGMEENVKEQLRLLIANGMGAQALEIVTQVRRLLPQDPELEAMERQLLETKK